MCGRKMLVAAAAAAVVGLGQGCGASDQGADTIGLAVANLQANFFNQIKQSVEARAAELGIRVITVDARGDGATQVSQVQDLLTQGIDALIYIPAGAAAATVPTRLARAQGVPVVNVDRNAEGEPGDAFLASDSVTAAYNVCQYLFEQVGGVGQMIIIHGQQGTTPEVDRSEGCKRALDEHPDIDLVAEQWTQIWSQDEGFQMTQNMLQAHPEVEIIFGQADALALGAAQAVRVAGLPQRIWIGGFDGDTAALTALRDGVFDVTATQQTRYMGRLAVDRALALARGEDVPAAELLEAVLTTPANVGPFIDNHP